MLVLFLVAESHPKTPATCAQFRQLAAQYDIEVTDTVDIYNGDKTHLLGCELMHDNIVHLEFYEFDNKSSAADVYNEGLTLINQKRDRRYRSHSSGYANYMTYDARSEDTYYRVVRVENTVLYGTCPADTTGPLNTIISDLGYGDTLIPPETTSP